MGILSKDQWDKSMISGTGKVGDSMTLFEGSNNDGNMQAAPGSTEGLGTSEMCVQQCEKQAG